MGGEESKLLYDQLLAGLRKGYKEDKVQTGVFGAMMQVCNTQGPNHTQAISAIFRNRLAVFYIAERFVGFTDKVSNVLDAFGYIMYQTS